jgi:hypothetical protein
MKFRTRPIRPDKYVEAVARIREKCLIEEQLEQS